MIAASGSSGFVRCSTATGSATDARRQTKALTVHCGIGELTSVAILAKLGDRRRFSSSRHAVRYVGLGLEAHWMRALGAGAQHLGRGGRPLVA